MSETKTKFPNSVQQYRERLGFTQGQLAHIVGCKNDRRIRRIESGEIVPSSLIVFRLAVTLRVPVDFLYLKTIDALREDVRAIEERMPEGIQGVLPLPV